MNRHTQETSSERYSVNRIYERRVMDSDYLNGVEDGVVIVKELYELSTKDRIGLFATSEVATILDNFSIMDIKDRLKNGFELKKYKVIRGIRDEGTKLKVVVESARFSEVTEDMVLNFLESNDNVDFADVKEIYVRELQHLP